MIKDGESFPISSTECSEADSRRRTDTERNVKGRFPAHIECQQKTSSRCFRSFADWLKLGKNFWDRIVMRGSREFFYLVDRLRNNLTKLHRSQCFVE